MKLLVTGLILTTLSGAVLFWAGRRPSADAGLTAPTVPGPERRTRCMVWKAERGGATVWLCGSIHLLRESDYPLPEPYLEALASSRHVIMELAPGYGGSQGVAEATLKLGRLPAGKSLQDTVSGETWQAVAAWSRSGGTAESVLQPMKPWLAGLTISVLGYERQGFRISRGMEAWFRERLETRTSSGLETAEGQLAVFDRIAPKVQEEMILQAIAESREPDARFQKLIHAWREGDAPQLAAVMAETMQPFPELKKLLLDDRNAAWLPQLEQRLSGTETTMVLVGCGHLAGQGSVIDLLAQKGVKLTQMEYRTTRPETGG